MGRGDTLGFSCPGTGNALLCGFRRHAAYGDDERDGCSESDPKGKDLTRRRAVEPAVFAHIHLREALEILARDGGLRGDDLWKLEWRVETSEDSARRPESRTLLRAWAE